MNRCCKDCTDRFVGCHSVCMHYIEYKQTLDDNRIKRANFLSKYAPTYKSAQQLRRNPLAKFRPTV